mgnify:CR=1 FL=1
MCTAITYHTKDHYFGRNLDLEGSFGETVTVTPRNFPLPFHKMGTLETHYAMIGMAHIAEGYPLYYDATNEKGFCKKHFEKILASFNLNFPFINLSILVFNIYYQLNNNYIICSI